MNLTIENLKNRQVYLYGCGIVGRQVYDTLNCMNVDIKGFIVSKKSENPPKYGGACVEEYESEKAWIKTEDVIIVTIVGNSGLSVKEKLEKEGKTVFLWDDCLDDFWSSYPHKFIDRRKGKSKVLLILAGYKEFLWNLVFERVKEYEEEDTEICIISSGLYSEKLAGIAAVNDWSYLSTEKNNVSLIQNIAIALFKHCEWIYKMDEDIFLTKKCLKKLQDAYLYAEKNLPYHMSVIAPLIPLNEAGCRRVLEKYGCLTDFENRFGRLFFGGDGVIINTPEIAPYMWGKDSKIPDIDKMSLEAEDKVEVCAGNFNIGMILFKRNFWKSIHGLQFYGGSDFAIDEKQINECCCTYLAPLLVAHSVVVGHFSFGAQQEIMREYLMENPEKFELRCENETM